MRSNAITYLSFGLLLAQGGNGQGIVSIDPIGFEDDGLAGSIAGTGSDGTTYVLTGTQFGSDITMTLVEDGFHVSETANIPTGTDTLKVGIQCAVGPDSAFCTEIIDIGDVATTTIISGANEPTAVQVGSGAVPQTGVSQSTITSLPSSGAGASSTSVSVLPPVVTGQSSLTSSSFAPTQTSALGTGAPSSAGSTLPLNPTTSTPSGAESNRKFYSAVRASLSPTRVITLVVSCLMI